jgi:hypothetical protein
MKCKICLYRRFRVRTATTVGPLLILDHRICLYCCMMFKAVARVTAIRMYFVLRVITTVKSMVLKLQGQKQLEILVCRDMTQ